VFSIWCFVFGGGGNMAFLRFEDVKVFQLAEKLADESWNTVITWNYFEKDTVGKQLIGAADSIGANIAEGAGRGTPKDNRRFVRIARGSFNETKVWLRRAYKRNLINDTQVESFKILIDEIGPSLIAYLKSIGGRVN
jgi:four helix bundle protein